MKVSIAAVALTGALALAAPAVALPPQASDRAGTPGPSASAESKRKAYGAFCRDQSKKHVEGQKRTPFSQCVTAMAKAARSESTSAREACRAMSKEHVEGQKGTPFSQCVVAAAKLKRQQEQSSS